MRHFTVHAVVLVLLFVNICAREQHHVAHYGRHLGHVKERDQAKPTDAQNYSSTNGHLEFYFNASDLFGGIYNASAKVGNLFDINANISVIYNETSNTILAFNYKTQLGALFNISPSVDLHLYLSNLTNLTSLFDNATQNGLQFNLTAIPQEVSNFLQAILKLNPASSSVKVFLEHLQKLAEEIRKLAPHLGDIQVLFNGDLRTLLRRFEGLIHILDHFGNGTNSVNISSVELGKFLNATNGLSALLCILNDFGHNFNLSQISDPRHFFSILNWLGGSSSGLDGLLKIFFNLTKGNCPPLEIVNDFLHFFDHVVNVSQIESEFIHHLEDLQKYIQGLNGSQSLSDIISGLLNHTLLVNNTNICPIISALLSNTTTGFINNIIQALVKAQPFNLNLTQAIPLLLQGLYSNLIHNNFSLTYFQSIFSALNLTNENLTEIIHQIQSVGGNLTSLLQNGINAGQNLTAILQHLPFASVINEALSLATQGAVTLFHLFSPETFIKAISGIFGTLTGLLNGNGTGVNINGQINGNNSFGAILQLGQQFVRPFIPFAKHHEAQHKKGNHAKDHEKKHQSLHH